ncbi:MAG: ATP-binding protein [Chloroflexota bacterium]|nr:ATP-binding protein [Chloroflexota bacterium]
MVIINLLSAGPHNTLVYHLLVLLALEALAGIALIEWRYTRNPDSRRTLWTFAGLLVLRIPLLFGEMLGPVIIAPLISGLEVASLALLGWAFLSLIIGRRAGSLYLICSLSVTFTCAAIFLPWWYRALTQTPNRPYVASWQQSLWHGVSVLLALIVAVILLYRRRERHWLPISGFAILGLGFTVLCASSLLLTTDRLGAETATALIGLGRLVSLASYPFFAIAVYRSALQDLGAYRQELQAVSEQALRQSQELHFLVEVSRAFGASLDLDTILHRVVESTAMAMSADRCAIFLTNPDEPGTVLLAAQYTLLQRTERQYAQSSFPLAEQPTLDYVLRRRKPLILNVETDNPRLRSLYGLLGSQEAGPTIVQPFIRQRRVLGVLVVGNDRSKHAFGPNDGRLCRSIAVQVSAAIENGRLYRDLGTQANYLAELLQSQEEEARRMAAILESVAEGVIVSDKEGHIIIVNAAAERILGAPRQRILNRSIERLMGRMTLDPQADWGFTSQSDTSLQTVFELENKVAHVNAAPVLTPAGDHLGVVAVLRDITRETEAERAKSEFITAISHELRTPLTAIRGYADAISSGMVGAVDETQSHFLGIIRDNALRMGSLADNLIAVSQIEKGFLRLEYGETDLHLLLGSVVLFFQSQLEARQLEVSLEIGDSLPLIQADPARLRQIVDNLVSNAIKFTYPGGNITIGAQLLSEGKEQLPTHCAIWVSDTGIGIPPEEQAHIWERFYRPVNPLAVEASGLGVGLSIVKSLVEAHSGRVWLESTPSAGSKFTVLLPIKPGDDW